MYNSILNHVPSTKSSSEVMSLFRFQHVSLLQEMWRKVAMVQVGKHFFFLSMPSNIEPYDLILNFFKIHLCIKERYICSYNTLAITNKHSKFQHCSKTSAYLCICAPPTCRMCPSRTSESMGDCQECLTVSLINTIIIGHKNKTS